MGSVTSLDGRSAGAVAAALFECENVAVLQVSALPCHHRDETHDGLRAASGTYELIAYRCGFRWWARRFAIFELPAGALAGFDVAGAAPVDVTGHDGAAATVADALADLLELG
ncbi:hypothetical protein ACFVAJ_18660 [Agromyces sp. NPDC057679]|uniref:hypothetical protein n=1 Tax=Agromyces sp. NPDC057679 TaxID=3346207 RepID=UPI00366B286D